MILIEKTMAQVLRSTDLLFKQGFRLVHIGRNIGQDGRPRLRISSIMASKQYKKLYGNL